MTVGTFRIVRYIVDVRYSGVSVKRDSTVVEEDIGRDGERIIFAQCHVIHVDNAKSRAGVNHKSQTNM